ncbi:MAG: hypothetical protein C0412_09325, partial [Flavobacterium sp.]|nr:hypothetical protein [Flavobacterium sp.]
MKIKNKKIFFICLLIIFFALPLGSYALEINYPNFFGLTITQYTSLSEYAKYFFNLGMALAGTLAVLVIIFGGIYYLISFSRGKFTNEGKEWVKSGIIGLIILLSAYLIVYTINPDLIYFRLERLIPILSGIFPNPNPPGPSVPITIYNEIPIGTLTENLLTRTTDCYDFDDNGDPIPGKQITTDDNRTMAGPTYLDHDRADCLLKLSQATEKKAQIVKKLSDEITKLMNLCSCSSGADCKNNTCAKDGKDCIYPSSGKCPINAKYIGCTDPCKDSCSNKSCSCQGKNCESCPKNSGIKDPKTNKELTVKEVIERGPIKITDCNGLEKNYAGLDEFRSQFSNSYAVIKNNVELQPPPKLNGKEITIINN